MTSGRRFLARGRKRGRGETALGVLAYNIVRVINLIGAASLRARGRRHESRLFQLQRIYFKL